MKYRDKFKLSLEKIKTAFIGEEPMLKRIGRVITDIAVVTDSTKEIMDAEGIALPPGAKEIGALLLDGPVTIVNIAGGAINAIEAGATIAKDHRISCESVASIVSAGAGTAVTAAARHNGMSLPESLAAGGTVGSAIKKIGDEVVCPALGKHRFGLEPLKLDAPATETALRRGSPVGNSRPYVESLASLAKSAGVDFLGKLEKEVKLTGMERL